MLKLKATMSILALSYMSTAMAVDNNMTDTDGVKQQYAQFINQGKTYRDAFEALQYEIAYEQAAVQAKSPCRKLVRGL